MKKRLLFMMVVSLLSAPLFAEVTVQSVKGTAGVLEAKKLTPVKVGMKLKDDATVVTGANSEVNLLVNNGIITLKSLTTAKLRGVSITKSDSKADVALRSGTVVSDVKQITGLKTSFTVTTPVGTSSVRGTRHTISYSPGRGMRVAVASGVVAVRSNRGATKPVAQGQQFTEGQGAAPPQVATQAAQDAQIADAASTYAPAEETAMAESLGGESTAYTELANIAAAVSDSATVQLTLVFP